VLARRAIEWVWRDDFEMSDVKRFEHTTVMRDEVVRALAPRDGGVYVDATLGGGGAHRRDPRSGTEARASSRFDRDPRPWRRLGAPRARSAIA
jgi:16S rRNA C1402 N4-methylase RsmH